MATVTGPLAEGGHLEENDEGKEGYGAVYLVKDVAGTDQQILRNALAASGVPRRGQRHPTRPTAFVTHRRAVGTGGRTVRVTITYEDRGESDDPADERIRVGTSLRTVETNKDVNGALLTVMIPGSKDQSGTVSVERPISTIHVSRKEASSPGAKSRAYAGKVNGRGQFRLAGGDVAARTWRCNYITGESTDQGETWQVDYEFEYDKNGWDKEVAYIDPETGRIPEALSDAAAGSITEIFGLRTFQVYEEANFNNLQL